MVYTLRHNPYIDLGVSIDATDEVIRKSFKKLALSTHPDKGGSTEAFHSIQAAYSILSDSKQKADLDSQLGRAKVFLNKLNLSSVNKKFNSPDIKIPSKDENLSQKYFDNNLSTRKVEQLPVKQLKIILEKYGISTIGLITREELETVLRNHTKDMKVKKCSSSTKHKATENESSYINTSNINNSSKRYKDSNQFDKSTINSEYNESFKGSTNEVLKKNSTKDMSPKETDIKNESYTSYIKNPTDLDCDNKQSKQNNATHVVLCNENCCNNPIGSSKCMHLSILTLGCNKSGKTSFIRSLLGANVDSQGTDVIDYAYCRVVTSNGICVHLRILDVAGNQNSKAINADLILAFHDINKSEHFQFLFETICNRLSSNEAVKNKKQREPSSLVKLKAVVPIKRNVFSFFDDNIEKDIELQDYTGPYCTDQIYVEDYIDPKVVLIGTFIDKGEYINPKNFTKLCELTNCKLNITLDTRDNMKVCQALDRILISL